MQGIQGQVAVVTGGAQGIGGATARRLAGEGQAMMDLGLLYASQDYKRAGHYFQQALSLAERVQEDFLIARSLNRVGNWYVNIGRPLDAIALHRRALEVFQQHRDERGIAETLDLLAMTCGISGDLASSLSYYREAIRLFRQMDDRYGLVSSLGTLPVLSPNTYDSDMVAPPSATLEDFTSEGEIAVRLARDIGWQAGESYALLNVASALIPRAEYSRALTLASEALVVAEQAEHRQWMVGAHCTLGAVYLDALALSQARDHLLQARELTREMGSSYWQDAVTSLLALTYVRLDSPQSAAELLGDAVQSIDDIQTVGQRQLLGAWVELALHQGDTETALRLIGRLQEASGGDGSGCRVSRLSRLRGEALTMAGRYQEAEAALREAISAAHAYEARSMLWRTHIALGHLYKRMDSRDRSRQEYASARRIVHSIASQLEDEGLSEGFVKAALGSVPDPSASRRWADKQGLDGLTSREVEVATLVAQGMSNLQISSRLVVSERTVESHVRNIMSKLGTSSRSRVASWAVSKGLVTSEDAQ